MNISQAGNGVACADLTSCLELAGEEQNENVLALIELVLETRL